LRAGATLRAKEVAFSEPSEATTGFAAHELESVLGRQLEVAINAGEPFTEEMLAGAAPHPPEWFSPRPPRSKPG
jgi:hypothetical protein